MGDPYPMWSDRGSWNLHTKGSGLVIFPANSGSPTGVLAKYSEGEGFFFIYKFILFCSFNYLFVLNFLIYLSISFDRFNNSILISNINSYQLFLKSLVYENKWLFYVEFFLQSSFEKNILDKYFIINTQIIELYICTQF